MEDPLGALLERWYAKCIYVISNTKLGRSSGLNHC
jgi:hypothetical protein